MRPYRPDPNHTKTLYGRVFSLLPDFCWQTKDEIITMMEYYNENLNEDSIVTILMLLSKCGFVEKRPIKNPIPTKAAYRIFEYKKAQV